MPDTSLALRRWLFLFLVLSSTTAAVVKLWTILQSGGLSIGEALFLFLFAILFGWIAIAFWLALFGVVARLEDVRLMPLAGAARDEGSRTAILMPVYNEDVARVFSGVRAIYDSLRDAGEAGFEFYILSDSTDPAFWIAEEVTWEKLRKALGPDARIFYRHRHRNAGRKSGNIQDFCENWGALYDYMVVLDADSLMTGETLGALKRLMDANPRAGLIQAPAQLVGRQSLFARIQQFASSVYGPTFSAGLAWLQGPDGNYWGHNAIIRMRAFLQHGGLPRLSGKPPFGGEIMSHDFVEAAFLRRAGWEVWIAPDLGGSFEEPPPSVYDYLKRDRRWAQGNLQHSRVLIAQGIPVPARLHMLMGVMSYISSPLWLLMLVVSALSLVPYGMPADAIDHAALLQLVVATVILLYAPKLLAMGIALRDSAKVRAHGGFGPLLRSVFWEAIFATLFAPAVMLAHSWYVLTLLMGISTGWGSQVRDDRALPLWFVISRYWAPTLIGASCAALLWRFAPADLFWYAPLLAGLLLTIPLVRLTSSLRLGAWAARRGLFLIASETVKLPVLERAHRILAAHQEDGRDFRRLVLEDATVQSLHLAILHEALPPPALPQEKLAALAAAAKRRDTAGFSRGDWNALLSDPASIVEASSA
ncbi:MAG TPA: glucans biosynthesis glucosyltransferase MdoH [Rhizomicrobium sp.]|nr:glucans biosynthesis glucosyltransferase MdoH [Rhizomicrobium sp.]